MIWGIVSSKSCQHQLLESTVIRYSGGLEHTTHDRVPTGGSLHWRKQDAVHLCVPLYKENTIQ